MSEADWYEVTAGSALLQGDLLKSCPVFVVTGTLTWPAPAESALDMEARTYDLIVMTQSCDLANNKVQEVLLAQVVPWSKVVSVEVAAGNEAVRSSKFRKLLIEGNVPGLSLLHKHEANPPLPWCVVDFHRLFTLPKQLAQQVAHTIGPRLRLRSPYREHLAQAFARYFMRVGLPHDARAFEKEGEIRV